MGGKRNENVSPRWSGDRRAFQRAKRFRENGGLVLDARAGIFIPNGNTKTFAEMTMEDKNAFSHRRKATEKLIEFPEFA